MRPTVLRRALTLLPVLALGGCGAKCDFTPRCEGNVVMECEIGVDQLVGRGSPRIYPCVEPAPVCVEARAEGGGSDGDRFFCAREPLVTCDDSFQSTCEGTVRVSCQGGYVTAEDCTNQPLTGRCGRRMPDRPVQCL